MVGEAKPTTTSLGRSVASGERREILQTILGNDQNLRPLKQLLIERTEGNPFFIEEMSGLSGNKSSSGRGRKLSSCQTD